MGIKELKKGYSYQLKLVDGDNFTGEFDRIERGFVILKDYANKEHVFRIQSISSALIVCSCCGCTPCDCH